MFNLFQYHLKISLRYSLYNACKPYHHQNNTYSFERPYTCYAYAELIIRHGLHAQCRIAMNMGPTFHYTYTHTDWFCACWCKVMLPFIHCILLYDDFEIFVTLLIIIMRITLRNFQIYLYSCHDKKITSKTAKLSHQYV